MANSIKIVVPQDLSDPIQLRRFLNLLLEATSNPILDIGLVDDTSAGLMAPSDKTKLDYIEAYANKYVHPLYPSDNLSISNTFTGAQVLSSLQVGINTNETGHVVGVNSTVSTRNLSKSDIGLGNVDNTSDANKPVSDATQTALDGKVDDGQVLTDVPVNAVFTDTVYDDTSIQASVDLNTTHRNKTDNPHLVTKLQIGLGNVDNTSDANKPVSDATQTALDGYKSAVSNILDAIFNLSCRQYFNLLEGIGPIQSERATIATRLSRQGLLETLAIDEARFESAGYLSECKSTNIALWSEDLTQSEWIFAGVNKTTDTITEDDSDGYHIVSQRVTVIANKEYTSTFIIYKDSTEENLKLEQQNATDGATYVLFNCTTGEIIFDGTNGNYTLEELSDRYIISITATPTVTTTGVRIMLGGGGSYLGDNTTFVKINYIQMEKQPIHTSYIKTEGTAVPRAGDITYFDTADNFPNLKEDWSMKWVGTPRFNDVITKRILWNSFDINNYFSIVIYNSEIYFDVKHESSRVYTQTAIVSDAEIEVDITCENGIVKMYVDGILKDTDDFSSILDVSLHEKTYIGSQNGSPNTNFVVHTKELKFYAFALSGTEISL